MCPQGHPHQLEPILLKHFHMVLKAEAKRKARGKVCKALKNQIVRTHATHAHKIWIREMIMRCLYVSLLRTYLSYIVLRTYSNSIQTTQPSPPPSPLPHFNWILRKRLDEQDNITTRSDVIPSPCLIICRLPYIHPWSLSLIHVLETYLLNNDVNWLLHFQDLLS